MNYLDFELTRPDLTLKGSAWLPEQHRCSLLIEHGMAEHGLRYAGLAEHLAGLGVAVFAYDKRGHGRSAGPHGSEEFRRNAGLLAEEKGWQCLVDDSLAMVDWILGGAGGRLKAAAATPLFLLGHSMGSFVVRELLVDSRLQRQRIGGCILSGTAGPAGLLGALGAVVSAAWVKLHGALRESPFLDRLVLGGYSAKFKSLAKPQALFDWISSDSAQVAQYVADPYCGMVMRTSFYRDLLSGLAGLFRAAYRKRFPQDTAILLISGAQDPVGGMGKGVRKVYADYVDWGVQDVRLRLFADNRHEVFHDKDYLEAHRLVSDWIFEHLPV